MKLWNKINNDELKQKMMDSGEERITLSFYKYHQIFNPPSFRDEFYIKLDQAGVFGRIYVAHEGINGQISVPGNRFEDFLNVLNSYPWLQGIRLNTAIEDNGKSFYKLKILQLNVQNK